MKVDYISDLHINHHVQFNPNQSKWEKRTKEWASSLVKTKVGEVLIIAGDFSEWNRQSIWVLEVLSEHYERIFLVVGNHDYYLLSSKQKKKYGNSLKRIEKFLDSAAKFENVFPLQRRIMTYKGVTFAGDSMWYKVSPKDNIFYKILSNDSRFIHLGVPFVETDEYLHEESMEWYKTLNAESIDVFISHVPPIHPPESPYEPNSCYNVEVPFLVAKHWVCGHQHAPGEFEVEGVQFHMNPLGYPSERHTCIMQTFEVEH